MYVIVAYHKQKEALSDLCVELYKDFPLYVFNIEGSQEKGYKLRLEGTSDETFVVPVVKKFLKTWKPKPPDDTTTVIEPYVGKDSTMVFTPQSCSIYRIHA